MALTTPDRIASIVRENGWTVLDAHDYRIDLKRGDVRIHVRYSDRLGIRWARRSIGRSNTDLNKLDTGKVDTVIGWITA